MELHVFLYAINEDIERIIEFPSERYPYHPFRVGHFRSLYQRNGFNCYLKKACGETLMSIFEIPKNTVKASRIKRSQTPINWPRAKDRIKEVKHKFKDLVGISEETLSYHRSLEIVEETIDFVLSKEGDGLRYCLDWEEWSAEEDNYL